ncbi:MAG: PAS domain-containing protein, partial [Bacteroidota bacterium]
METVPQNINNAYLKGGGEMGELVRHFNWSQTSLGAPHTWPQSLLTTVSNLLRSRFPMFLWWGNNMIQFYNDAYRPSLGVNGKHPAALGQKGIDCWQEIWPVIYPLIEQVKNTGEATWNENQLIPIYRNGVLEDVYWTFSYSLVLNDDGNFGGVLVTCMETTESVQAHKSIEESEKRFRSMIEQAPVAIGLTRGEDFIFESINVAMLEIIGKKTKDDVLQKKLVDVLPELTAQPVYSVLQNVLQTGNTFRGAEVAVDMVTGGILQTRYYNITNSRIVDNTGEPFILHMAVDVTAPVIARRQIEQ